MKNQKYEVTMVESIFIHSTNIYTLPVVDMKGILQYFYVKCKYDLSIKFRFCYYIIVVSIFFLKE